jgi:hypothetical protein
MKRSPRVLRPVVGSDGGGVLVWDPCVSPGRQ